LYAQEFEQQAYENLIYPLMLVYPLGGSLSGTSYTRNYRVVIADRVLKSEGNELEVESDTQLIALDTLAYWMKLGTNERFSITSSNTITPFWEKWGDEVTGHFVDIGIEEFYDFNSCSIPLSSAIPSPVNPCKDARILINSVVYGNAPSDTNFNVVVKDQLGALVGSLIGGEWIVNTGGSCADATYTIEDSLGNILYTGTIPSGGSVTEVIGNSTLNVNKSDGTLISSRSILAEGTDSYNVGDSSAVLKDESGNVLSTTGIKATESKDIVAPNGDVSVNSVAFDDVLSGGTLNIEVRKSTGNDLIGSKQGQYWRIGDSNITNSDSTYDVDVKATESLVLPDSQINVNSVDSGDVVSVKTIDVNLEDSLGAPVVPTSVGLVGNTLTIEVPNGATPMNVDFSADKLTALIGENITFTDLSDQTPTHWSWRFSDGTTSIVQNPVKNFLSLGFKNVTLLAGKIGAGNVNIKNSYIEIMPDADAQAFLTATGITDGTIVNAINELVGSLKNFSLWTKIKAIYPMVGGSATTHKFNLKDPRDLNAAFRLAFNGGWTHSANGALPNGSNAFADTFFVADNELTYGSASLSFYSKTNSIGNFSDIGSYGTALNNFKSYVIQCRNTGDVARSGIYDGSSLNDWATLSNTSSLGYYIANRQTTTNNKILKNGTSGSVNAINVNYSLLSNTFSNYIGAANNNGAIQYSNRQCAFATLGNGLTDTEASNLTNIVQTFQTTLGRQV
jgi:PKD repeat protein